MVVVGFYRVARVPYMDTILKCPACLSGRGEKQGIIIRHGHVEHVWYLGCECSKPVGIL